MPRTSVKKEKEVKKVNVKPLAPSKRLSLTKIGDTDVSMNDSLKDKAKPGSIHDILEQMTVSPKSKEMNAAKLAVERWGSARQIYDEFCTETSFTALTRIHKAKHVYKRIAWLVVCLAMVSWMTIQCIWLFEKYFSYPVEVKIEKTAVPKLEFPSITVCNLNPLKRSKMHDAPFTDIKHSLELDDSDMLYDDYISDLKRSWENINSTNDATDDKFMSEYMQRENYNKWNAMENDTEVAERFYAEMDDSVAAMFSYSTVAVSVSDDEIKQYGHQENNLIMSCTWEGKGCSPANFTYIRNNKYGNCYMLNSIDNGQEMLYSTYAGPLMGLTLEFNIEQDEYVPSLSSDAGVRVMIHKRGTYPFPEDDGVSIPPGFKTSIGMEQTKLVRLPPPHADCGNHGVNIDDIYTQVFGTEYSKQTCLRSCYQAAMQKQCGCASSFYQVPEGASVCTMDANFTNCFENECQTIIQTCSANCPAPCKETKYDLTISMSKWPSEQFSEHLEKKIQKSNSDFLNDHRRESSEDTLAKLEIYFKDLIFEQVEQQKAYESQNLISDLGGQLGLWLGLSAITVGELIEFIASICRLGTARFLQKKKHAGIDPDVTMVEPMDA